MKCILDSVASQFVLETGDIASKLYLKFVVLRRARGGGGVYNGFNNGFSLRN